jgi:hypothetical protein
VRSAWRIPRTATLGRIDDDTIVFRTDPGTQLRYAGRSRAAFEMG